MRFYYFTNWRVDLKSFIFSGEDYKSVCFLFSVRALYQYGYRIFEGLNKEAFSMTEKRTRHWMEWEQSSFIIWTVMVLEGVPNSYPFRVPGIIISSFWIQKLELSMGRVRWFKPYSANTLKVRQASFSLHNYWSTPAWEAFFGPNTA